VLKRLFLLRINLSLWRMGALLLGKPLQKWRATSKKVAHLKKGGPLQKRQATAKKATQAQKRQLTLTKNGNQKEALKQTTECLV
jgi:hypothetical protein